MRQKGRKTLTINSTNLWIKLIQKILAWHAHAPAKNTKNIRMMFMPKAKRKKKKVFAWPAAVHATSTKSIPINKMGMPSLGANVL